ncbi:MAG: tetratricopeptide repeat protein [Nitrospirae bacterium]|nr:tetratricopeptide repeat protein [Nitrospirota bacterium]
MAVLVFDYMGGADAVEEYFKTRGDQRYETYVYRRLGDLYMQMGRFKEAADIYEAFIHSNPLHEDDPYFQAQVIEAYTRGNFVDLAHEARIVLVETYREGGTWFQANAGESKRKARGLVQQHREQVRESMHELTLYHHARAQTAKTRDDWTRAVSWERRFLETFPEDSRLPQVRYLMAEGLFENGDFKEAGESYHRTAFPDPPDSPCDAACRTLRAESGYGELHALERLVKPDGKIRPDDPLARKWVEAGVRFREAFPDDPRIPGILLNEAEVRYQLQEFEPARDTLRQALAHGKTDDKTRYLAQRLLAESFLEEEAYLRTEEEIRKAIALIPKGREKDRPLLEKALASSIFKQGEALRDQGDLAGAARIFLRVGADIPGSAAAPIAFFEAAGLYVRLGEGEKAEESYRTLIRKYPDSPLAENSLLSWAELLAGGGRYPEAAGVYEQAAARPGRDPQTAADAAFLAGSMYEKAEDWAGAQRAFVRYRTAYPEGKRVVEALFKTAGAKERMGDLDGALRLYQEVVVLQKQGRDPAPEGIALAARAQFRVAEEKKSRFETVRLISPLEKNLAKKKTLLKEVLEGYTAAAKYRIDEITTASAFRMGEVLEHFRDALLGSERPADLTPEQLEQYDFLLEEQAYPFEEKAIAAYESNPRRTQETGVYDRWIRESYSRLAVLLPVRYQRVEQGERFTGEINGEALLGVEIPAVLNSAGIWYREQGDFVKAEDAYQRALRIDPRYPDTLFNLGVLNELYRNRADAALTHYRAYLQEMKSRMPAPEPGSAAFAVGEKGELIQKVELWIAALEKKVGGKP